MFSKLRSVHPLGAISKNIISHRKFSSKQIVSFSRSYSKELTIFGIAGILATTLYLSNQQSTIYSQNDAHGLSKYSDLKEVPIDVDSIVKELKEFLADDQIELDLEERQFRGKPWNSYHVVKNVPSIVVFPNSTEDVSKIMKVCNKHKIPIIPFGGGTSLEGHTLALFGGLSIDFSNMKNIVELNEDDLDVTVQAGIGYIELNELLKPKKLWFPLDPGPGASIGGMCACRCSGSTAVRYGTMRENVLNVTAVLADGTIIKTGSRARKSAAGYDIARLLVGSEGTLAVITEITLKLYGIPKVSHAVRISFPNGVFDAACTARDSLNCGVTIGRCELLDDNMIKIINDSEKNVELGTWPEHTTLLYEITGLSERSVEEQKQILYEIAKKNGGTEFRTFSTPEDCHLVWKTRKECLWSAMSMYPDKVPMITDVCVPLTKLPILIEESKEFIDKLDIPCPIVAHAGDGNFHVLIFFNPKVEKEVQQADDLSHMMVMRAIELGGTCSGEHGIGIGKKEYLKKEMGDNTISTMIRIKLALDENKILNPGKLFDIEPSSEEK